MKATLPTNQAKHQNGKNLNGQKELIRRYLVVFKDETETNPDYQFKELIDFRLYASYKADGAAPVYASIWIKNPRQNLYIAGSGRATGYGYHKGSAALASALESAGVTLDEDIDGRGDTAIKDALKAIAEAMGHTSFGIFN